MLFKLTFTYCDGEVAVEEKEAEDKFVAVDFSQYTPDVADGLAVLSKVEVKVGEDWASLPLPEICSKCNQCCIGDCMIDAEEEMFGRGPGLIQDGFTYSY